MYEQLYDELKENIVSGKYPRDTVLSSVRVMAKELQISRNTVDRAYQQLLAEGYIRSVPGSGYYVEDISNDYFDDILVQRVVEQEVKPKKAKKKKLKYDFKYSSIDSTVFPWAKWKKYVQNAIMDESDLQTIPYEENKGNLGLRECLCSFLNKHRGVVCRPEQVVICPGTQFAIEILSNILPANQYRLAYEEPGYDAMRNIFLTKGYNLTTIPVVEDGLDDTLLSQTNCNLLYMTPSHQFPTGVVTSIKKRNKILKWAYENDAYIIENDYDSEFRYGVIPIPSFQSLDRKNRVIYVGTLSKVMLPSIRCAYLVLPEELLPKYDEIYHYFNSALPSYHQNALRNFIEEGNLEKHIRKMSALNETKYHLLNEALAKYLKDYVQFYDQPSGVHTLARIEKCTDQQVLIDFLREDYGIGVYGTKAYYYNSNNAREDIFLIGFNAMSEQEIENGCKYLGEALADYFSFHTRS